jgi:hypothetical protein
MRIKKRVVLGTFGVYGVAVVWIGALSAAALVVAGIYCAVTVAISQHLLARAESVKRSNRLEFNRDAPLDRIGILRSAFLHAFECNREVGPAYCDRVSSALVRAMALPPLRDLILSDAYRDSGRKPDDGVRVFRMTSSPQALDGGDVSFVLSATRAGTMETIRWWILYGGERDPNRVWLHLARAPLALPFQIIPILQNRYDPATAVRGIDDAFYTALDLQALARSIQVIAFEKLVAVLDEHGVDTSDLKTQRANVMNVSVSGGGRMSIGSMMQNAVASRPAGAGA